MLDDQFSAGVRRGKGEHQGAHYGVVLLRILMGEEELALAVHQQRVRLGPQAGRRRELELVAEMLQRATQQRRPGRACQGDLIRRDLPGVADAGVAQCFQPRPNNAGRATAISFFACGARSEDSPARHRPPRVRACVRVP